MKEEGEEEDMKVLGMGGWGWLEGRGVRVVRRKK